MAKTSRISEEYHEWLGAHKREDETMEEVLRRMTRSHTPTDGAGLLSDEDAEATRMTVERQRGHGRDRLDAASAAFESEYVDG